MHRVSAAQRSIPGDLDFIDVPLTVDWDVRFPHRFGWDLPQELMIERGDVPTLSRVVTKNVVRAAEKRPPTPAICVATHNVWDYSDPDDEKTSCLEGLIGSLDQIETDQEVTFVAATVESIAECFRKELSPEPFLSVHPMR